MIGTPLERCKDACTLLDLCQLEKSMYGNILNMEARLEQRVEDLRLAHEIELLHVKKELRALSASHSDDLSDFPTPLAERYDDDMAIPKRTSNCCTIPVETMGIRVDVSEVEEAHLANNQTTELEIGMDACTSASSMLETDVHEQTSVPWRPLFLKYELKQSVWDASLLVGLDVLICQESLLLLVVGSLAFFVESFFLLVLVGEMIDNGFTQEMVQDLLDWRIAVGHDRRYAEAYTGESLISSLCRMSDTIMDGQVQAQIFKEIHEYGIRPHGKDSDGWIWQPVGGWMASLAIFVWLLTVIKEVIFVFEFVYSLCSVPTTHLTTISSTAGSMKFESIARCRACAVTAFVVVPRLVIAIVLAITGVLYLASTTVVSELIVNVVALEVVLNVDELLFQVFLPQHIFIIMKSIEPLPVASLRPLLQGIMPLLVCMTLSGAVFASHHFVLQPVMNQMQDIANVLCGGVTDFTFWEDAAGRIYLMDDKVVRALTKDASNSYAHRAVLQATQLDLVSNETLAISFPPGTEPLLSFFLSLRDLTVLDMTGISTICLDSTDEAGYNFLPLLGVPVSVKYRLQELFFDLSISTCTDAYQFCHDLSWPTSSTQILRLLCPVTCGCGSILKGSLGAPTPLTGCPQGCRSSHTNSIRNRECVDAQVGSPAMDNYLQNLLTFPGVAASGLELAALQGCNYFAVNNVTINGITYNFCTDYELMEKSSWQSIRPLCPVTCGCHIGLIGCPTACA